MALCYGNLSKRRQIPKTAQRTNRIRPDGRGVVTMRNRQCWLEPSSVFIGPSVSLLLTLRNADHSARGNSGPPASSGSLCSDRSPRWAVPGVRGRKSVWTVLLLLQGKERSAPECRWYASAGKTNKQNKQNMLFRKRGENAPK